MVLTHIVSFKLKECNEDKAQKTRDVLMGMQGKIEQLLHLEVGVDILHSERSYDIILITKFDSLKDLDAYQIHPIHQEVIAYMKTVVEASVAVDFES